MRLPRWPRPARRLSWAKPPPLPPIRISGWRPSRAVPLGTAAGAPDRVWEHTAEAFRQMKTGIPQSTHLIFPSDVPSTSSVEKLISLIGWVRTHLQQWHPAYLWEVAGEFRRIALAVNRRDRSLEALVDHWCAGGHRIEYASPIRVWSGSFPGSAQGCRRRFAMKTRIAVVGVAVAVAALAVPALVAAQGSSAAKRVEPFNHLTAPRVELGEATPGGSEMRRLCPNRLDVCEKYWEYTVYFVDNYTIPFRDKEILILRTAWLSRGEYIWGRHYVRGKEAGLTDEQIAQITEGPEASGWDDFDATLLRAADELHTSRFVSEATWNALAARYTEDQVREVVMIVGDYTQLAMFQNSLGAQLPPGYEGLPD